jgi:DNA topoisomerase-1
MVKKISNVDKNPTYLVIVESPGKITKIETILSKIFPQYNFIVKASYGHIIDLDNKKMSVDLDNNFKPSYKAIDKKKADIIKILIAASAKADKVLIATDEDREGEMIGWSIAKELNLENPERILFNSITETDLKKAIENPTKINIDMVNAQKARRVLDRIVGFEISPILWKTARGALSAGRVQSVVVKLIIDKEAMIENFMKNELSSFYKFTGNLEYKDDILKCNLMKNKAYIDDNEKYEDNENTGSDSEPDDLSDHINQLDITGYKGLKVKIKEKNEAEKIMINISKSSFKVANISKKEKLRYASPPFTTSTLQQEAARKLGYKIKQTMVSAQKLYEAGYITYMRTDSVNLSQEALDKISKFVKDQYGKEYLNITHFKSRGKNTQEAHEAIRPSDINKRGLEMKGKISTSEVSLYNLIWKRAVGSQMQPAKFNVTTIDVDITKLKEYYFATSMDELIFPGFLKVYNYKNFNNDDENFSLSIPKEGTKLNALSVIATEDYPKPPTRYNEASLVNKLDPKNLNIGRPSTYSPIIEKIQFKKYIVKENIEGIKLDTINFTWNGTSQTVKTSKNNIIIGKESDKFTPTDMGKLINTFLVDNFPDLMKYEFTSNMEEELDNIAEGNKTWTDVLGGFYNKFHPLVVDAMAKDTNLLDSQSREIGKDPKTGNTLVANVGPYGAYIKMINEDGKKVGMSPIRKPFTKETVTLEEACKLFEWPKELGNISRKKVKFYRDGKFGPYVKVGQDSFSIKFTENFGESNVDLDFVKGLVEDKKSNNMWEQKEGDQLYTILTGPYGMYVSIKNTKIKKKPYNVSIPDETNLDELTIEKLQTIIENRKKNRFQKRKGATVAKKTTAPKSSSKKVKVKKVIAKKNKD